MTDYYFVATYTNHRIILCILTTHHTTLSSNSNKIFPLQAKIPLKSAQLYFSDKTKPHNYIKNTLPLNGSTFGTAKRCKYYCEQKDFLENNCFRIEGHRCIVCIALRAECKSKLSLSQTRGKLANKYLLSSPKFYTNQDTADIKNKSPIRLR